MAEGASGAVIGECGVHYLEGGPDIELGHKLARAYWGQGLAAEAAQACLGRALVERAERVVAIVDPANIRSARVLNPVMRIPALGPDTVQRPGREHAPLMHLAAQRAGHREIR